MLAKEKLDQVVKLALEKDGWTITDDPLYITVETVQMQINLGASKLVAVEHRTEKIAVQINTFLSASPINDFHVAIGEFVCYSAGLRQKDPERELYLAIDTVTYNHFFTLPFPQLQIQEYKSKLIIYDADTEEIVKWVN